MIKKIIIICLAVTMTNCSSAQKQTETKDSKTKTSTSMFPEAKEGFQRFIIELEPRDDEDDFKIELYAGKEMEVDCNKHTLSGEFVSQSLKGWGYSYYNFNSNGNIMSTMMACPDGIKEPKFIVSKPILTRYNSKLPIVIYVPDGISVKYKIWERSSVDNNAIKG